jgi:hypothetical protein
VEIAAGLLSSSSICDRYGLVRAGSDDDTIGRTRAVVLRGKSWLRLEGYSYRVVLIPALGLVRCQMNGAGAAPLVDLGSLQP